MMSVKTPLYTLHLDASAKMVDFHGWLMPLHYGSQLEEHQQVRNLAGMFDVSHMTILDIEGSSAKAFLRHLLTIDVARFETPGKAMYSCMCQEDGGILDDLIVYYRQENSYRLVVNSATREKDLAWIKKQAQGFDVTLKPRPELAILAVQGPMAIEKTLEVLTLAEAEKARTLSHFEFAEIADMFIARTGYTGEAGFELMVPVTYALTLWDALIAKGVKPCGLGARDTLRLEAGMLLYGQDMDETTTPLESGLSWVVHLEDTDRDFIGRMALENQKASGIKRKMIGLKLVDKGIMRAGQKVMLPGDGEGLISSGTYSPTLGYSIAIARVPKEVGAEVLVDIRGKEQRAEVLGLKFLKK